MLQVQTKAPGNIGTETSNEKFRCGSLVYTQAGLFTLFTWLLWGDFCFSLMETIWPNILPLMLKAEGAPNLVISMVITTIPSAMNFVMNPIISTASDRHRSPRGRRIPFLLIGTPFVAVFLVLLGFSRDLGRLLGGALAGALPGLSTAGVAVGVICVLLICFRFFELFVNTVFWYLFNDVVPSAFMGRFLGFFRVVGAISGACFNFFLFRYAESHTSLIFFGVAVLYSTAFLAMCLRVKEGAYPPPDPAMAGGRSLVTYITTFVRECFGHRIFRLVFGYTAVFYMGNTMNTFMVFMAFSIGLNLEDVGKVAGVASLVSIVLMYPMGFLVDRLHPLRVMLISQAGFCVVMACKLVFLFHDFPRDTAFWIYAALAGLTIPINAANSAATLPMVMRIFPHAQFGQFCSANAMCGALGTMAGGVLAGSFLDLLKSFYGAGNYFYRFAPIWSVCFMLLSGAATLLVFREWKKLGGDESYRPPAAGQGA